MFKTIISIVLAVTLLGCDFEVPGADEKFGKQNFVSAVSIIEFINKKMVTILIT